jgi:hypothetical protein
MQTWVDATKLALDDVYATGVIEMLCEKAEALARLIARYKYCKKPMELQ